MKSKNKVLEGDELAAKLEEMKHDYPHILDYTDLDVQDREFVLSTLQRDEETQKELCTELELVDLDGLNVVKQTLTGCFLQKNDGTN